MLEPCGWYMIDRERKISEHVKKNQDGYGSSPRVGALRRREVHAVAVRAGAEHRRVGPRDPLLHRGGHVLRRGAVPREPGAGRGGAAPGGDSVRLEPEVRRPRPRRDPAHRRDLRAAGRHPAIEEQPADELVVPFALRHRGRALPRRPAARRVLRPLLVATAAGTGPAPPLLHLRRGLRVRAVVPRPLPRARHVGRGEVERAAVVDPAHPGLLGGRLVDARHPEEVEEERPPAVRDLREHPPVPERPPQLVRHPRVDLDPLPVALVVEAEEPRRLAGRRELPPPPHEHGRLGVDGGGDRSRPLHSAGGQFHRVLVRSVGSACQKLRGSAAAARVCGCPARGGGSGRRGREYIRVVGGFRRCGAAGSVP
jgi:hypothetical protein